MVIRLNGTASHYLAGDADRDLEAKVIDWTGLDPATPGSKPTLQQRIAIVKASHHGSAKSTPITMCQMYKPMFFVFSAGDKHRHPSESSLLPFIDTLTNGFQLGRLCFMSTPTTYHQLQIALAFRMGADIRSIRPPFHTG